MFLNLEESEGGEGGGSIVMTRHHLSLKLMTKRESQFNSLLPILCYHVLSCQHAYTSFSNFLFSIPFSSDEDIMSVLLDKQLPEGVRICTTQRLPHDDIGLDGVQKEYSNAQMVMSMLRGKSILSE